MNENHCYPESTCSKPFVKVTIGYFGVFDLKIKAAKDAKVFTLWCSIPNS